MTDRPPPDGGESIRPDRSTTDDTTTMTSDDTTEPDADEQAAKTDKHTITVPRRGVLASSAALFTGGILGYQTGVQRAEATSGAAGTVGTAQNPVDLFGHDVHASTQLDIPVYSDDSNAPNETHYWHSGEQAMKYKDSGGTVHTGGGGLQDGDNFDGQGTSDFSNLNSVDTAAATINTHQLYLQDTQPSSPDPGDVWIDTDSTLELNGQDWEEDANSPWNASGSQSLTYTMADSTYERIIVAIQALENTHGSTQVVELHVNGISGSSAYVNWDIAGTKTNSDNPPDIDSIGSGVVLTGEIRLFAPQSENQIIGYIDMQTFSPEDVRFGTLNLSDPGLDSVTVRGEAGTVSIKARVYGWSGGI